MSAESVFFMSAALHGDEIQGVEIIRRILVALRGRKLAGTVLAVPIVNSFGFLNHSRYMPDRRDLNRSFPGSDRGSLASLLAGSDLEHNAPGSPVLCMSDPEDLDCAPIFHNLGLPFGQPPAGVQTFLRAERAAHKGP